MNITGLSTQTFAELQVDAGAAFKNLGVTAETTPSEFKALLESARIDPKKMIGATNGGFNFIATATVRYPELDGLQSNVEGMAIVTSIEVGLNFVSKEIKPENWALAIGNATIDDTTTPGTTVITPKFQLEKESYTPEICFVGSKADNKTIACVQLLSVLNTNGINYQSNNQGEGALSFEMRAHLKDPWDTSPPYRIYEFEVGSTASEPAPISEPLNIGDTYSDDDMEDL